MRGSTKTKNIKITAFKAYNNCFKDIKDKSQESSHFQI